MRQLTDKGLIRKARVERDAARVVGNYHRSNCLHAQLYLIVHAGDRSQQAYERLATLIADSD